MEDLNQLSDMTAGVQSWIGLNDFNRKTMDLYPNSWRWSTQTRSRSGYMNFQSVEPNNWSGREECVQTWNDGTWNDFKCSALAHFVCFSGKNKTKPTHVHTLHSHRGIQTYRSTTPCFVLLSLTEIITWTYTSSCILRWKTCINWHVLRIASSSPQRDKHYKMLFSCHAC